MLLYLVFFIYFFFETLQELFSQISIVPFTEISISRVPYFNPLNLLISLNLTQSLCQPIISYAYNPSSVKLSYTASLPPPLLRKFTVDIAFLLPPYNLKFISHIVTLRY